MIEEGVRQFDLYDVISILLPGGVFVLGIMPFLPNTTPMTSFAVLVILLLASFVLGRIIHAIGLFMENSLGSDSPILRNLIYFRQQDVAATHRDVFVDEMHNPTRVSDGLVDSFYGEVTAVFPGLALPDARTALSKEEHADELETLYTLVRSAIHMDARGRSRTFQAILDFQRSTTVAIIFLMIVYFIYAVSLGLGHSFESIIGYTSFIDVLSVHWWVLALGAEGVFIITVETLWEVREDYRRYFVQYVFADFVNLRAGADSSSDSSSELPQALLGGQHVSKGARRGGSDEGDE